MQTVGTDTYNQKLIYHAGVSCNTDYCSDGNKSAAQMTSAEDALIDHWGMHADLKYRIWHLSNWESMLVNELDNNRPIIYAARKLFETTGHAWVIDAYTMDNSNYKFWCKWGWGSGDNWCFLGDWDPVGLEGPYTQNEQAIFEIYPVYEPGNIVGPATLTSSAVNYTVSNPIPYSHITWSFSSNIEAHYGGDDWIALKAKSSGTGWIDAKIVSGNVTITYPRKYVTLNY